MALIAAQQITLEVLDVVLSDATVSGDEFVPGERVFFHVKNNAAGSVTLTFADTNSTGPTGAIAFNPNIAVLVEPSGSRYVGPFGGSRFGNADDGNVHVTYSSHVSVKVAVLSLSPVAI